ncbi:MAG: tripartite tricarboxylate transporter substrate binding protein [Comamonadaceae bacterium]|nr:MAG: tripartite tricarboxylate transporter substrate binding protein [Comamonadaceae bacterium]
MNTSSFSRSRNDTSRRAFGLKYAAIASAFLTCSLLGASASAQQTGWKPQGTVEYVIPGGAGAALDFSARKLAQLLEKHGFAQTVVVQNKPGGYGLLALAALQNNSKNPNYLYTLTSGLNFAHAQGAINTSTKDYTPVATLFKDNFSLAVPANSNIRDATDFVERLKKSPDSISIAVGSGIGGTLDVSLSYTLRQAGVDITKLRFIPYKSSAESFNALLGGHVDAVYSSTPNLVPHIPDGKVRGIAVASEERLGTDLANIPTWKELGYATFPQPIQGILAAKDITREQQQYWENAFRVVTATPEWKAHVAKNHWNPFFLGAQESVAFYAREYQQVQGVLADLGYAGQAARVTQK